MKTKMNILAVLGTLMMLGSLHGAVADTFFGAQPVDGKKCQVRGATGTNAQGATCTCMDDPDGDPYFVWVCK